MKNALQTLTVLSGIVSSRYAVVQFLVQFRIWRRWSRDVMHVAFLPSEFLFELNHHVIESRLKSTFITSKRAKSGLANSLKVDKKPDSIT